MQRNFIYFWQITLGNKENNSIQKRGSELMTRSWALNLRLFHPGARARTEDIETFLVVLVTSSTAPVKAWKYVLLKAVYTSLQADPKFRSIKCQIICINLQASSPFKFRHIWGRDTDCRSFVINAKVWIYDLDYKVLDRIFFTVWNMSNQN